MDVITIAKKMYEKIILLEQSRQQLEELAKKKSLAVANYEKELALMIIKLRSGEEVNIDNNIINIVPVSIVEKIAKGACWESKLEADRSEAMYKAKVVNMSALTAELNGYQSINKYIKDEL